jgi:hypothetical protein
VKKPPDSWFADLGSLDYQGIYAHHYYHHHQITFARVVADRWLDMS